jgi:cytochrome oxidase assembly protein ShyY1
VREILRQRRWLGFSAFVLVMLGLCVVLANWQWNRYQQRSAENDLLDAALTAPAVPVDDLIAPVPADPTSPAVPADRAWRMVTATGRFDEAGEVAIRRRPLDGRNGYWIVTPLITESGTLLVNRGWTPADRDAISTPEVPAPPPGEVTVTGRLRPAEATSNTGEAPEGQAWAVDPQVLVTPGSTLRYNAYVELRESAPAANAELTALSDPGHRGLNNLIYSVQWIIFAAVGAFGWWRLIRQESLHAEAHEAREAAREPEPAEDAGAS